MPTQLDWDRKSCVLQEVETMKLIFKSTVYCMFGEFYPSLHCCLTYTLRKSWTHFSWKSFADITRIESQDLFRQNCICIKVWPWPFVSQNNQTTISKVTCQQMTTKQTPTADEDHVISLKAQKRFWIVMALSNCCCLFGHLILKLTHCYITVFISSFPLQLHVLFSTIWSLLTSSKPTRVPLKYLVYF